MSEHLAINVRLADGTIKKCSVEILSPLPWRIIFSGLNLQKCEFAGDDLFEALIALRLELERTGAQALCAGSRPDVFPSGMSRDMSGGRKAYVTRLGSPSRTSDLVDIFDYAEPESVSCVEDQKLFHKRWIESLKLR